MEDPGRTTSRVGSQMFVGTTDRWDPDPKSKRARGACGFAVLLGRARGRDPAVLAVLADRVGHFWELGPAECC